MLNRAALAVQRGGLAVRGAWLDNTLLQFGGERLSDPAVGVPRWHCATCGQGFTAETARFCPFDGERLTPAPAAADPLLGQTIDDRYEVLALLGEGGMGAVYRVRHRTLGRMLAMKVLRRELAADDALATRFIQEARAAAAVQHPAVVQILDFGSLAGGRPYFVMELLGGHSLSSLLKRGGPLPAGRAVRIGRTVADALGAAHAAGVVHRDLKPDNIHVGSALGDDPQVKVLDFGLAQVAGASRLTRAGMVFGTPHYMSPEQAAGEAVDHRADIYALGVVLYEMFTGRVPFEADTYMGVLTKHIYVAPTPPSQIMPDARELGALEDVILRCLEKKPAARYGSMAELVAALDEVTRAGASAPRVARGRPQPNLLADELEAPTAAEVSHGRRALRPALRPVALFALGAGAVALVAAIIALSRSRDPAPAMGATPSGSSAAAVAAAVPAPVPTVTTPPPAPTTVAPVATVPAATTSPPVRPPTRPAGAPVRPVPAAAPAPPRRSTGSEIIDPWAQ